MATNILPFEKKTNRFYKFYFKGYDKPLIIEAENKSEAEKYLIQETDRLYPYIQNLELEDIRIITPVYGITEKEENKTTFIWAGFDNSQNGWLTKAEFEKLKKHE